MSLSQPFRHALPVSEALFHEALYLTHVGWERIAPGEAYPQRDAPFFYFDWHDGRMLPEFCLALVVAGGGELQTRAHTRRLRANDAFLFRPGEWHRHRPSPQTGWTLMWIHFNGDEPLRWLREDAFCLRENLPVMENRALFRAQFEHLLLCVHRHPSVNCANFSRQAIGLLAHFLTDQPGGPAGASRPVVDEVVKAAVEYIWNFSHDIVDVPAVAHKVGLARRTLDRRFRAVTGRSVLAEIQFCRVSRAAKLLQETAMPIKHIVQRAGFRSDEHLRIAFQKAFGRSPQAFRQQAATGAISNHSSRQPPAASGKPRPRRGTDA
jgi:AraC-like DNA-binding protein